MSLLASFLLDMTSPGGSRASFTNEHEFGSELEGSPAEPPSTSDAEGSAIDSQEIIEETMSAAFSSSSGASAEDESSYAGQTILSSAPSDTILNIDRLEQTDTNPWPGTNANSGHPLSVSTAASCYMELESQEGGSLPRQDSFASLSFHASGMDSSFALYDVDEQSSEDDERSNATERRMERITNTASFPSLEYHSALPLQSTAIVLPHRGNGTTNINSRRLQNWYAQFSERDWETLRQRAQMAVRALTTPSPPRRPRLTPFQLPPSPPPPISNTALATHPTLSLQEIGVPRSLPNCFVCPICKSAIVGALTLDCDCGTTVCSACWEYHSITAPTERRGEEDVFALARGLEYEIVVPPPTAIARPDPKCPCCCQSVHNPVPCHALDVAILQMVQGLNRNNNNNNNSDDDQFEQLYYERLRNWREEVMRRQEEEDDNTTCLSDEVIAGLIQEDEALWRRARQAKAKQQSISLPGAIGFFVAIVASVGIRVLTQRRVDGRGLIRQIVAGGN